MITVFNRGTSPSLSDERWKSSAWVLAAFQNRSLPLPCPNAAQILQPALSWIYISLCLFTWHQLDGSAHFSVEKRGFDRPNIENELKMSSNPSRKWTWKWLLGCEQHPWASWPSSRLVHVLLEQHNRKFFCNNYDLSAMGEPQLEWEKMSSGSAIPQSPHRVEVYF